MKLGTALSGGLLLLALVGASRPIQLATTPASSLLAPDIPAQSSPPPGSCTRTAGAPDTWRKLSEVTAPKGFTNTEAAFQVTVDPWRPCLMYRATSPQDLQRSLDSGGTWQRVLQDTTTGFAASDLQVPRQDSLVMAESGGGDAMLRTDDQGHAWRLADGGIEGQRIASVEAAPSNPDVLYAVVDENQTVPVLQTAPAGAAVPFGLYVSHDGGTNWLPGVFPTALATAPTGSHPRPHLAVDPQDPATLWMFAESDTVTYSGGTTTHVPTQSVVLQSTDSGTTWMPMTPPGKGIVATQLLAVHTPGHPVRLYANLTSEPAGGSFTQNTTLAPPAVSLDEGRSWQPLPVVALMLSSLAADPADPDRMVYAGYVRGGPLSGESSYAGTLGTVSYTVTDDGWQHSQTGTSLNLGAATAMLPVAPLQGNPATDDAQVLLQADRFGTFYLLSRYADSTTTHQALFALTPAVPSAAGTSAAGGSAGNAQQAPPAAGAQPSQPPVAEMPVLRTCNLPASEARDSKGALTFDGDHLLYTSSESVGAPDTGTILRLDPQTCAPAPSLTVHFDPAQINAVAQRSNNSPGWTTPVIDTVAYDPGHDTIWMSVADAGNNGCLCYQTTPIPVFSATVDHTGGATPSTVNATLRFFVSGAFAPGIDLLAYDDADDTLWSRAQGYAAHVDLAGNLQPSCWDAAKDRGEGIATWVVGGPGRLYVQSEDNITIWEVESSTCQLIRTFQHRDFGEPQSEDEQMACDAMTFGAGSAYAQTQPAHSVLWLRDALNHQVIAYEIPDGVCPLPTATKYLGSGASPQRGETRFCAQLSRRNVPMHIANRPLVFSVADRQLGSGLTNAAGVACVDHPLTLAGGAYPVVVRFLGDSQYLPSQDAGTLSVAAGAVTPVLVPGFPGQPPSSGQPPEPGPVQQAQAPQAASQAETQVSAQSQAQVQSQSQAQSVAQAQPGVAVQRRSREQVATQRATIGNAQDNAMLASRRRTPGVALQAVQLVALGLMLGLGVVARRPARALAWRRRRG